MNVKERFWCRILTSLMMLKTEFRRRLRGIVGLLFKGLAVVVVVVGIAVALPPTEDFGTACLTGSLMDVIRHLVRGADCNDFGGGFRPLLAAINPGGDELVVRALVIAGADVNVSNGDGQTVLMYACQETSPSSVSLLIRHGADVAATDHEGQNALMHIGLGSTSDMIMIAKHLISAGCDVHHRSLSGETAIERAKALGNVEFMEFMEKQ